MALAHGLADRGEQVGGGLPVGVDAGQPSAHRGAQGLERAGRGRQLQLQTVLVGRGLAVQHEYGDVVGGRVGAHQRPHHRGAHRFGGAGEHRLGQPVQTHGQRPPAALDQAVGVQAHRGARRQRDGADVAAAAGVDPDGKIGR